METWELSKTYFRIGEMELTMGGSLAEGSVLDIKWCFLSFCFLFFGGTVSVYYCYDEN